jgi:predicted permease
MLHDVRLGIRHLLRRPGFAFTALVLLALGAGANAAVFSVVRGVLLRPLPFSAPEQLVAVWPDEFVSNGEIGFWRDRTRTLGAIASVSPGWLMALTGDLELPLKITGARVSDNLFAVLGIGPALGRTFVEGEGAPGRERVIVISDALWRQRFAADRAVLGRVVLIDQVPHEVIGVMPPGFEVLGRGTDLWVPLVFAPGSPLHRQTFSLALGRLRPGVAPEAASRELASLVPEMRRRMGKPEEWGQTVRVRGLQDSITSKVRPTLALLLGAVGFILLIGAVNLGTLVLGGSIARARELAVRAAVGASRVRLIRQLLVEQAVLAGAGSIVGLGLARAALPLLVARIPPEVPRQTEIVLDGVVFVTIFSLTVGLAVVMAFVPALVSLRPGLQPLLRQQAGTGTPGRQHALGGLVAAQVALALVLGIGAALTLRSLWQLQRVDPGFDPSGALTFRLQTTSSYRGLTTGLPYLQEVAARLGALPGVTAMGAINHLPMSGYAWATWIHRPDRPPAPGTQGSRAAWRFIWGDYFGAMRIPLVAGRIFTEADTADAAGVAIVNETLAREHFGGVSAALGQRLVQQGGGRPGPFDVEIVGIVGDVRHNGLDSPPPPEIYRPLQQTFMFPMQIVLRASADPAGLAAPVRQAAYQVDATVPVADLQPLPAVLADSLGRPRLLAFLLSVFAAIGVLLSVVGLYGVVAVRVAQRVREIGIRMALGASPRAMAAGVVRQGIRYAIGGLLLGIPAALALTRYMDSVIFGITARDPLTFVLLPLLLVAVTALACYLPARRAAGIDPVAVMRGGPD